MNTLIITMNNIDYTFHPVGGSIIVDCDDQDALDRLARSYRDGFDRATITELGVDEFVQTYREQVREAFDLSTAIERLLLRLRQAQTANPTPARKVFAANVWWDDQDDLLNTEIDIEQTDDWDVDYTPLADGLIAAIRAEVEEYMQAVEE